jgi:hypothetical protein
MLLPDVPLRVDTAFAIVVGDSCIETTRLKLGWTLAANITSSVVRSHVSLKEQTYI